MSGAERGGRPVIYVSTDLEGAAGVDRIEQMDTGTEAYAEACNELMRDVNAAVAGVLDGGAGRVIVQDGHASGDNFLPGALDPRAEQSKERFPALLRAGEVRLDGLLLVGYHAMAGTINGFLDHTQSSRQWYNYYINGRRCGEIAQLATMAGGSGVPVLMVSGDEAACAEARAFLGEIETAAVKRATGRNRALLYPEDEARSRIREAARRAIGLAGRVPPFRPLRPLEIRLELYRTDYCEAILARSEGIERLDARTLRKVTDDPCDILF